MWWRSSTFALGLLAAAPHTAFAVDRGRLALIAREVGATSAVASKNVPWGMVLPIAGVALVAALLGAWIGLAARSSARLRERNGWRELTYRFHSTRPLRVDGDMVGRMTGVLDELEEFCRRFKSPAAPVSLAGGELAAAGARLDAAESLPVRFTRRSDTNGVRARWNPDERPVTPAPVASVPPAAHVASVAYAEPAAGVPTGAPSVSIARAPAKLPTHVATAVEEEPFAPAPRDDRATSYRAARRLLEAGHDREDVRRRTGLKLAEIDLLRCAGGRTS